MPPLEAQAPIEMHHFGWGICCQMRRMIGASLNGTLPAQISTSAWRGEKLIRSMPNLARSNRLAAVAMNSIAQQAVPNGIGQSEFARLQLTRKSRRVATQPSCDSGTYETAREPWAGVVNAREGRAGVVNPIARLPFSRRR